MSAMQWTLKIKCYSKKKEELFRRCCSTFPFVRSYCVLSKCAKSWKKKFYLRNETSYWRRQRRRNWRILPGWKPETNWISQRPDFWFCHEPHTTHFYSKKTQKFTWFSWCLSNRLAKKSCIAAWTDNFSFPKSSFQKLKLKLPKIIHGRSISNNSAQFVVNRRIIDRVPACVPPYNSCSSYQTKGGPKIPAASGSGDVSVPMKRHLFSILSTFDVIAASCTWSTVSFINSW